MNLIPARLSDDLKIQPSTRVLRSANSTCMEVLGQVESEVMVAGLRLSTTFLVSDQIDGVIIGVNWLHANRCHISFLENTMSVQGRQISFLKKMSNDKRMGVVYVSKINNEHYGKSCAGGSRVTKSGDDARRELEC